jgi:exoribonuclease R
MDEQNQNQRDSSVPRIIWFKPTDKRVPLIAIPVEQAPPGFIENSDEFENRLFLVCKPRNLFFPSFLFIHHILGFY